MTTTIIDKARVPTRVQRSKRGKPGPTAPIDIITAISDPAVFGNWFHDIESWAAWAVVLKTLFGIALEPAELATFQKHTGRTTPAPEGYFDVSLVVVRRGGKSLVLALIAAYFAAFFDWAPFLTGGERATIMIIAADRRQAGVIFRYLREMLDIPLLRGIIQRETNELLELSNGVNVEIATASFRTLRGRTVVLALADEVAFWLTDSGVNPDSEIIGALKPAMATIPNARLLKASSPYARRGVLWGDYERHYGAEDSRTLIWKAATREMNPSIPQSVIDDAYAADPAHAAAEYGAEFRTDVQNLFDRDAIRAVTILGRLELPPVAGIKYVAFCDPSGGSADSMTLAIAHVEGDTAVLDAVRERRPPFSPEDVVDSFCKLLRSFGVTTVRGDRYGGEWPREQFSKRGIRYEVCERTTSDNYLELLPALNAGLVELLDHQRMLAQLVSLERRTARTGKDTISHPPKGHDDIATAVAGALTSAGDPERFKLQLEDIWTSGRVIVGGSRSGADLTSDENYRLAAVEFENGRLTDGRDVAWYLGETRRRAARATT